MAGVKPQATARAHARGESNGGIVMKVIGLIGGVSWESSAEYYRLINQEVKTKLGVEHSAELVMYSLDFQPVAQLEHEGKWDDIATLLADTAQRLQRARANFVLVASNTLHKVAPQVQKRLDISLCTLRTPQPRKFTRQASPQ